jgi:hypothetical protein
MISGSRPILLVLLFLLTAFFPGRLLTQEAPDTIVMKGPTVGAVTFPHVKHVDFTDCLACHHESKPELPATNEHGRCSACHTDVVEAPLTTNRRDAFHDRRARDGLCVTCHVTEREVGKTTPARCSDCHKDDNG